MTKIIRKGNMNKLKKNRQFLAVTMVAAISCSAFSVQAAVTNFSTDVSTSIDMGLDYLTSVGAYNNPSSAGDAAGLTTLALLEKRVSSDPNAPTQGYDDASVIDQGKLRKSIAYILNRVGASGAYSYRDGADLMALSLYARTGGPDRGVHPDLPAALPHDLTSAINLLVDRFGVNQDAFGYWCYGAPGCRDSSTTQFAVAGLSAAKAFYTTAPFTDAVRAANITTMLSLSRVAYASVPAQSPLPPGTERGHGYNLGNVNSLQQTGSGVWIQLAGGADVNDGGVQSYMEWVRNRYGYTNGNANANGGWGGSSYYYLWSSSKAYQFIEDSGVPLAPGNIGPEEIGILPPGDAPAFATRELHLDSDLLTRVPLFGAGGLGYYSDPEEPARVYFDNAYTLLNQQDGNGRYTQWGIWNSYSAQAYALLVLQRSVGGGCIDTDGDGVCDSEDNCPATPNPDQSDVDGDGVGDVCDNCVHVYNPDQQDSNGNGIGDACEITKCDVDSDGDIDISDIRAIYGSLRQTVPPASPLMDFDDNGVISITDARSCVLICTNPRCAP